jgi:hypothetical protein
MSSTQDTAEPPPVCCVLAAHAAACLPVEATAALRRQLAPPGGAPFPANFLKHADEQTIAGLAAVFQAMTTYGLAADAFRDWGVVGSPRFLGLSAMAHDFPQFLVEGAWDVSPHMIPHRSLHSTSGTVSQALGIHGPNFGAGGGPGSEVDGLLAAAALLRDRHLDGVWLVCTCLDPEQSADPGTGKPRPGTLCRGLALALKPVGSPGVAQLELAVGKPTEAIASLDLIDLADLLTEAEGQLSVSRPLAASARITLRRLPAGAASGLTMRHGPHFHLPAHRPLTPR